VLNKQALVKTVSELEGLNPEVVQRILDRSINVIETSLIHGESVTLRGFGEWTVKEKPSRKARNPHDGSYIDVPSRNSMRFRTALGLRQKIRDGVTD
jgi:integration host factor subunit beta